MRSYLVILGIAAFVLAGAGPAAGQGLGPTDASQPATRAASRPTQEVPQTGCVTGQCHAGVKDHKVLHGPVNVNACDACHKLTDARQHKFDLARNKTEICTFCHKMDTHGDSVVHKPVKDGDCLPCHDPHGAVNKSFLRGASMNDLCKKCHPDVIGGKKIVHGPVAAGACGSCHQAHSSKLPKLLTAQGNDLCFSCHSEMKAQLKAVKFTHKAVEGDCTKCHDAHASNYAKQTTQPAVQMCTACHEKVKAAALDAKYKHSVVIQGDACLNCHTAHGGDLAKLMRNQGLKVCMSCHDKAVKDPDGTAVPSVAEVLDPKEVKHGPIQDGGCGGCHEVHGSQVSRLLAKPYPDTFYEAFDVEKYSLCFACHDKQLVLLAKTSNLTGFRNGDVNLHYLHVNKARQGRSCRACHSTHASKNPLHIRESVPYGNWQLPVNYARSDNGGKCAAGCHQELAYDRVKPVTYAQAQEGPAGATGPAASGAAPASMPGVPVPTGSPRDTRGLIRPVPLDDLTGPPASAPSTPSTSGATMPAAAAAPKDKEPRK